jgi:hypothetical protein
MLAAGIMHTAASTDAAATYRRAIVAAISRNNSGETTPAISCAAAHSHTITICTIMFVKRAGASHIDIILSTYVCITGCTLIDAPTDRLTHAICGVRTGILRYVLPIFCE